MLTLNKRIPFIVLATFLFAGAPVSAAESFAWNSSVLSPTAYGEALAVPVAKSLFALPEGKGIFYGHRDYCGMGLVKLGSAVVYTSFNDGEATVYGNPPTVIFSTPEELSTWLAQQSDKSLSLEDSPNKFDQNNQTLNKARLNQFLIEVTR